MMFLLVVPATILLKMTDHNLLVSQLNNSPDNQNDNFLAELTAITSHRTVSGVLELEVEYNNGEHSWY